MNSTCLERVCLRKSDAVIILANRTADDPELEDGANILRVISCKNYHGKCRIIVQIISYHNKKYLFNIANWDHLQDDAICIHEFGLGFLAQSSLAPGFSTLLANLFFMVSFDEKVSFILFYFILY